MKGVPAAVATATASAARTLLWEGEKVTFDVTRKERDFIMRGVRHLSCKYGTRLNLGRALCYAAWDFNAGPMERSTRAPILAAGQKQPISCWIDAEDAEVVQEVLAAAHRCGFDDEVDALIAFFEGIMFPLPVGPIPAPFGGPERASTSGGIDCPCHDFQDGCSPLGNIGLSPIKDKSCVGPSPRRLEDDCSGPARARPRGDTPDGREEALLLSRSAQEGVAGYGLPSSLADLATRLDVSQDELVFLCRGSVWCRGAIAKRGGGKRPLTIPNKRLREIQTGIARLVEPLAYSPLNYCRKGLSVKECASQHLGSPVVGHLDIEKFFESVSNEQVEWALARLGLAEAQVLRVVIALTCLDDSLPQGSPSSNILADLVLAPADLRIREGAERLGVTVTRWVDGYVASGRRRSEIREMLALIAREIGTLGLGQNKSKRWVKASQRTLVHGLRVWRRVGLSKAEKKRICGEVRRVERYGCNAKEHHSLKGKLARLREYSPDLADKLGRQFARVHLHE